MRNHSRLEGRSDTVWEGHYKSSPVQTEEYLLACCLYIELNPLRARMVAKPGNDPWSSCRLRFGETEHSWLDYDPCYLALGENDTERRFRYRGFLQVALLEGK